MMSRRTSPTGIGLPFMPDAARRTATGSSLSMNARQRAFVDVARGADEHALAAGVGPRALAVLELEQIVLARAPRKLRQRHLDRQVGVEPETKLNAAIATRWLPLWSASAMTRALGGRKSRPGPA
jgi:hypothetical protein